MHFEDEEFTFVSIVEAVTNSSIKLKWYKWHLGLKKNLRATYVCSVFTRLENLCASEQHIPVLVLCPGLHPEEDEDDEAALCSAHYQRHPAQLGFNRIFLSFSPNQQKNCEGRLVTLQDRKVQLRPAHLSCADLVQGEHSFQSNAAVFFSDSYK